MPEDQLSPLQKWWVKWSNWEFWPFSVLYFPVWFYYCWLALKRGSLFFFTASNPSIAFGGMLGEKKSDIYPLIPPKYIPATRLFDKTQVIEATEYARQLGYPLIAKPDIGERGTWVEKIKDEESLKHYIQRCPVPFLIQELIKYPIELGIFYVRYPEDQHGRVSSIVQKDFLSVVGDGRSSVRSLLANNPRAILQVNFSNPRLKDMFDYIPDAEEKIEVEPIGNHCRGTRFLNLNHAITPELNQAFDKIASQIPDFYFGRFDLRCRSLTDLETLTNFKIIELNGAGAEPGHIYQPGYSLTNAYRDIFWHLATLAKISYQNKKRGQPYWPFLKGIKKIIAIRKYDRKLNTP